MVTTVAVKRFNTDDVSSLVWAYPYSKMKFGHAECGKSLGSELAEALFMSPESYRLFTERCVVIPSPYNHVKNAATVMTDHFCNRVNELLVGANGQHVESSFIHREVSYINDYGKLSKGEREVLISQDKFYFNKDFIRGKTLIFVDDIRITGTHEQTLITQMEQQGLSNPCMFLYYAIAGEQVTPHTESALNTIAVKNLADLGELAKMEDHQFLVRPLKYVLGHSNLEQVSMFIDSQLTVAQARQMYFDAIREGYYRLPAYQAALRLLQKKGRE